MGVDLVRSTIFFCDFNHWRIHFHNLNQVARYASTLVLRNYPESVVLESSVKPSQYYQIGNISLVSQKIKKPMTLD